MVKRLHGLSLTTVSSRASPQECLSVKKPKFKRLPADTILAFSLAIKDLFMHLEKTTLTVNLVLDIHIQQSILNSSHASEMLERRLILLSAASSTRLPSPLLARYTRGVAVQKVNLVTDITTVSSLLEHSILTRKTLRKSIK